ncbi:MAG: galactose-1-phosphate uridylyltransferase [Candidatus Omnitrophica bacterium]|nr:galactose-1-phosphate uridylyltransferase [Candidatus Omnitrophota bacterium]MCF7893966.1 galactose-1-phosphate uridylyltransferase [Candidatus Omnitrophota bacterium]
MKKLRLNPITKRWVILTEEDFSFDKINNVQAQTKLENCPFCLGNEAMTPPETDADRPQGGEPNSPGWLTRTVPNKFPALEDNLEKKEEKEGIFQKREGVGFHEVIIETPDHYKTMRGLSQEEITRVIKVYRRRFSFLTKDKRFKYILIFKNHGLAAGASLEHPHTQLICLPIVPKRVTEELDCTKEYFAKNNECMFCKIIEEEKKQKDRLVLENEDFIAFCPFFSRSPFELTILPTLHQSDFRKITDRQIDSLSSILKELFIKLGNVLGDYPYNFLIHTTPINSDGKNYDFYHWHIEFLPKLGEIAGFEWATGGYINPLLPEDAARRLNTT